MNKLTLLFSMCLMDVSVQDNVDPYIDLRTLCGGMLRVGRNML